MTVRPITLGTLQCPSSFGSGDPFSAKVAYTISSTLDDLQLDITLRIHERIYEFFSPWHYPLSLRTRHDVGMHSVENKEKKVVGQEQAREWDENSPPPLYLRKRRSN